MAVYAGHPALWDTKPLSDYLQPTVTTTEQASRRRRQRRGRQPQPVPESSPAQLARH